MQQSISMARPANWSARLIAAIGAIFRNQSFQFSAICLLGIVAFFAFTLGAMRFGALVGLLFLFAIRPYVKGHKSLKSANN